MDSRFEVQGHVVEIAVTGTGLPPDYKGGQSLNASATFWRVDQGKWHRTPLRSHHETARNLPALIELLIEWNLIESARG
jgi:hypothetical protein